MKRKPCLLKIIFARLRASRYDPVNIEETINNFN